MTETSQITGTKLINLSCRKYVELVLLILYRFKIKTLFSKSPFSSLAADIIQPVSPLFPLFIRITGWNSIFCTNYVLKCTVRH